MSEKELVYNLDISESSTWLTVTAAPSVRASFAYVQELGNFLCGPGYFTTRRGLPSYMIQYCLSGEGVLQYDGASYPVRPGMLFWLDCTRPQHYETAPGASSWHLLWVHFYGPTCREYHQAFLEKNDRCPVAMLSADTPVSDLFSGLFDLYRSGNNSLLDDISASGLLTQLMVRCIQSAGLKAERNRVPAYVESVRAYIDVNYAENISLDSLAKQFSLNKFYLQKVFKRYIGLSPNDYLTRTRLNRAKHLLRTSDSTMLQIAQAVGYTATYFDSVFKKCEGITPRAYRRMWYDSRAEEDGSPAGPEEIL